MTFQEKSALTMTSILLLVFAVYFVLVLGPVASSAEREFAFTGLVIGATVVTAVLAATSHVVLALVFRSQASAGADERDRLIALRSERVSGYILAVGMFSGIVLAMMRADAFWIAQVLLGAWVVAEITGGILKLVLYRRGA